MLCCRDGISLVTDYTALHDSFDEIRATNNPKLFSQDTEEELWSCMEIGFVVMVREYSHKWVSFGK